MYCCFCGLDGSMQACSLGILLEWCWARGKGSYIKLLVLFQLKKIVLDGNAKTCLQHCHSYCRPKEDCRIKDGILVPIFGIKVDLSYL